jgi:hypothetical protein
MSLLDYNGERTTGAIISAASDRLPDKYVKKIASESTTIKITLEEFYAEKVRMDVAAYFS